jgi:uncharacterized protein (DUF58 family)
MKFNDNFFAIATISIVLALLWYITGGVIFFAALFVAAAIVSYDYYTISSMSSDIRKRLSLKRLYSKIVILPNENVHVTYHFEYFGRKPFEAKLHQPLSETVNIVDPLNDTISLSPDEVAEIWMTIKRSKFGEETIPPLRIKIWSTFFNNELNKGEEDLLKIKPGVEDPVVRSRNIWASSRKTINPIFKKELPGNTKGSDFSYLRNYVSGDNIKNIDWARSYKSKKLIVRQYEGERSMPVIILLDVDSSMAVGKEVTELDSAVSMVVPLINDLLMDNERIGIACFSRSDVVSFRPAGTGRVHITGIVEILINVKPVESKGMAPLKPISIGDAYSYKKAFNEIEGFSVLGDIMEETINGYSANIKADGFIGAINRSLESLNTPSTFIILTNLSMGISSMLNGLRMIKYYGHNATVVLTPHIWYEEKELIDSEKYYERYMEVKAMISKIKGSGNVSVIDLSGKDTPDDIVYQPRALVRRTNIRR